MRTAGSETRTRRGTHDQEQAAEFAGWQSAGHFAAQMVSWMTLVRS